jgi:hypothetical protein
MATVRSTYARLHVPAIASFIMLVLFSGYYFVYFRSQQAYFTQHNFRLLALLTHQFRLKTDNLFQVLNNSREKTNVEQRRAFVSLYVRDLRYVSCLPSDDAGLLAEGKAGPGAGNTKLSIGSDGGLRFASAGGSSAPSCAGTSLKALFAQLVPADALGSDGAFDSIALTDKAGTVVFQTPESADRITRLGPFQGPGNIESNNLFSVRFAGTDYDVFSQPFQLTLKASGAAAAYSPSDSKELTLYGLVRHAHFVYKCLAIPYKYILGLISLLLLALFSYPFLKISSMNPRERFLARDGLALIVFTFTGTGLLAFLLLGLYYDNYAQHQEAHDSLKKLADMIEGNLTSEIRHLAKQLGNLDGRALVEDYKRSERPENVLECSAQPRSFILADKDLGSGLDPYFGFAFWTDAQGCQRMKWTTRGETTPALNVSGRPWYQDFQLHPFPFQVRTEGKSDPLRFGLWPNFSLTTGEHEVILSVPTRRGQALQPFADTKLRSLMSAVLPPGFGFAVISPDGDVLFHSEQTRSQAENLFEECDHNAQLRSLVSGRSSDFVHASYRGRTHYFYVTPIRSIEDCPWSLVVFEDSLYPRTAYLESLTLCSLLFILYTAVLFVPCVVVYSFRSVRLTGWMWPDDEKAASYRQLVLVNGFLAVILLMWVLVSSPTAVLYGAVIIPALAICLGLLKLNCDEHRWIWKRPFTYLLAILGLVLAALDLALYRASSLSVTIVFLELLLVSSALFLWSKSCYGYLRRLKVFRARGAYILAAVSLMVVIAVIPCFAFFKVAYDFELELAIKNGQIRMADGLSQREEQIHGDIEQLQKEYEKAPTLAVGAQALKDKLNSSLQNALESTVDIYCEAFLQSKAQSVPSQAPTGATPSYPTYKELLAVLRPLYNQVAVETQGLIANEAADGSWRLMPGRTDQLILIRSDDVQGSHAFEVSSVYPALTPPAEWMGRAALVALPVILLLILGLAVRFVAQELFLLDVKEPACMGETALREGEAHGDQLVLGVPFSGKSEVLEGRNDLEVIDVSKNATSGQWAHDICYEKLHQGVPIVIDQFEHRMDDPECNQEKLYLLEELVHTRKRDVVILSTVDPLFYFSAGGSGSGKDMLTEQQSDRWARVMMKFSKLWFVDESESRSKKEFKAIVGVCRWKAASGLQEPQEPTETHGQVELYDLFEKECGVTRFLRTMGCEMVGEFRPGAEVTSDQLISEVLDRAGAYYRAIWGTCSKEEKLALVQLAQEGLLNPKARAAIWQLLRKRLIVPTPFRMMNESFRRFVIAVQNPEEISAWEHEAAGKGWGGLKGGLVVVLGLALVFLLATQQALYNNTLAVLTGLTAAVPVLIKFFNIFRRGAAADRGE